MFVATGFISADMSISTLHFAASIVESLGIVESWLSLGEDTFRSGIAMGYFACGEQLVGSAYELILPTCLSSTSND